MKDGELPDPKNPAQWHICIVLSYKTLKGVSWDDTAWNKIHFAECTRPSKKLLEATGTLRMADLCLNELAKRFEDLGRTWTLHTIARWAYEWALEKGIRRKDVPGSRKRFFDALAQRSSKSGLEEAGNDPTLRKVLDRLRNRHPIPS